MTTATAERPLKVEDWQQPFELALLDARKELELVLKREGAGEDFINATWLQFQRNPTLQHCTHESIKAAAVNLALSGLDITQKGEVWLIPMENRKRGKPLGKGKDGKQQYEWTKELECVVWDGYLGRLKLARHAPGVVDVWFDVVREHDTYRYRGQGARPQHEYPAGMGTDRGAIIGAYCVVEFQDGRVKCLQMSKAEVLAHRDQYARAADADVWQERLYEWRGGSKRTTDKENRAFQHMVCKVVINQLCHPRHLDMPRHAAQIITRQEQLIAEHLTPQHGEAMQPTQPSVPRAEAISELFPDPEAEAKTALLDRIRAEFAEVVAPLVPQRPGRMALAHHCFGCKEWKDLPHIPLGRLRQGRPAWERSLAKLRSGIPEASDDWTVAQWTAWLLSDYPAEDAPLDGERQDNAQGEAADAAAQAPDGPVQRDWRTMLREHAPVLAQLVAEHTEALGAAADAYRNVATKATAALDDATTEEQDGTALVHQVLDAVDAIEQQVQQSLL